MTIELLKEVFKRKGHTLNIKWMNLARAIKTTTAGRTDGICSLNNRFNDTILLLNPKLIESKVAVWVRKDSDFNYDGVQALKDKRVGNIQGFVYKDSSPSYQKMLEKRGKEVLTISGNDSVDRMFKLISKKRVDVFSINPEFVYYILGKKYINENFKVAGVLENKLIGYFGISPLSQKKDIIQRSFTLEIMNTLRSKKYESILRKYRQLD